MSTPTAPPAGSHRQQSLAPIGELGFRGRRAKPEERAQVFDAFFFEGARRVPYLQQFFVLMLLSATIAAFGLVNDSAAVVIGAMLVAPLMTPILAIAAAVVQGWRHRAVGSLAIVGAGALCAIGVGVVVSFIAPILRTGLPLPGELLARTSPNMIDLGIALAAGAAGGFVAVRTEASGALPGVGIAVALVPPLATVGLTAGLGHWDLSLGALLLFATNLVAIVFAASLVFIGAGFAAYRDEFGNRDARLAAAIIVVAVVLVGIPLFAHSMQKLDQANAIATVARNVEVWAPDQTLDRIEIDGSEDPLLITVGITGAAPSPDPSSLAALLAADFGKVVDVDVVFVPVSSGSGSPVASQRSSSSSPGTRETTGSPDRKPRIAGIGRRSSPPGPSSLSQAGTSPVRDDLSFAMRGRTP
jgi:uncharacterized hydrophobic protein (TIGR00271 family)